MRKVETYLGQRYSDNKEVLECLIILVRLYNSWSLNDSKFETDFTSGRDEHFYGYIWEMVLARHLKSLGLDIQSDDEGPDFSFTYDNQRIWVEAICPGPEGLPDDWLVMQNIGEPARVRNVPYEQILLRWTAALKEKKEKLTGRTRYNGDRKPGYLETGVVDKNEPYVVAISACRLGSPSFLLHNGISQLPYAVEAAFPVGPIQVIINRDTMETTGQRHSYRRIVKNRNDAEVRTDNFLNPAYSGVSAILGTPAGINTACGQDAPFALVHNPLADNPLPQGLLRVDQEFVAEDHGDHFDLRDVINDG